MPPALISTSSAAAVVPPGEVTALRNSAGASDDCPQQRACADNRLARQRIRRCLVQPRRSSSRRQRFDQQEHIGRTGSRHGRHRIHLCLRPAARARSPSGSSSLPVATLSPSPHASDNANAVTPMPIAPGVFGIARAIFVTPSACRDPRDRHARHDRDNQRLRPDPRLQRLGRTRRIPAASPPARQCRQAPARD